MTGEQRDTAVLFFVEKLEKRGYDDILAKCRAGKLTVREIERLAREIMRREKKSDGTQTTTPTET